MPNVSLVPLVTIDRWSGQLALAGSQEPGLSYILT